MPGANVCDGLLRAANSLPLSGVRVFRNCVGIDLEARPAGLSGMSLTGSVFVFWSTDIATRAFLPTLSMASLSQSSVRGFSSTIFGSSLWRHGQPSGRDGLSPSSSGVYPPVFA
ncbi:MAG: hypothetical protein LBD58_08640 [Treponema sp.]|nr:hypothetical protein [Treponema sp.]